MNYHTLVQPVSKIKRWTVSSGSTFEKEIAYSRAVVCGDWVFVSGTTGFDYQKMTIASDIVSQTKQCFENIAKALQQADSELGDVVRVTYMVPEADEFQHCWPVIRHYFANVTPAATMISCGLADPRMKIEIEVTAIRQPKNPQWE